MTKPQAYEILANAVAAFIHDGGTGTALVGHNRLDVLELADAMDKIGYTDQAAVVRSEGSKLATASTMDTACPHCQAKLTSSRLMAGQTTTCPHCRQTFTV